MKFLRYEKNDLTLNTLKIYGEINMELKAEKRFIDQLIEMREKELEDVARSVDEGRVTDVNTIEISEDTYDVFDILKQQFIKNIRSEYDVPRTYNQRINAPGIVKSDGLICKGLSGTSVKGLYLQLLDGSESELIFNSKSLEILARREGLAIGFQRVSYDSFGRYVNLIRVELMAKLPTWEEQYPERLLPDNQSHKRERKIAEEA